MIINTDNYIKLRSSLSNQNELDNSTIGMNPTNSTTIALNPCKFGDGADIDSNSVVIQYDDTTLLNNLKGTIEFWWSPNYDSNASPETVMTFFDSVSGGNDRWLCFWHGGSEVIYFYYPTDAGNTTITYGAVFSAGDVVHIKLIWDIDGIDGTTDTIRMYYNGVDVGSVTSTTFTKVGHNGSVKLGGFLDNNPVRVSDGVFQELRVLSYAKSNSDDIEIQSPAQLAGLTRIKTNENKYVLWNKLTDDGTATSSELGLNGVVTGTITYGTGKYGSAPDFDANTKKITFADLQSDNLFLADQGTIDLWYIPNYDSSSAATSQYLFASSTTAGNNISLQFKSDETYEAKCGNQTITSSTSTHTSGDEIHLRLIWDTNGIDGGSPKIQLFKNAVSLGVSTSFTTMGTSSTAFRLGVDASDTNTADGLIDNVKVLSYANSDLTDRLQEGINYAMNKKFLRGDDRLLLMSTCEDDESIETPFIGKPGVVTGAPSYAACKYDNGVTIDTNAKYFSYTDFMSIYAERLQEKGTISLWWKPNFTTPITDYYLFSTSATLNAKVQVYYNSLGKYKVTVGQEIFTSGVKSHTSGDLINIRLCWDSSGIDGTTDTFRLYLDEVDIGSSTSFTSMVFASQDLIIGNDSTASFNGEGVFDAVRVWNYANIDFTSELQELPYKPKLIEIIEESKR